MSRYLIIDTEMSNNKFAIENLTAMIKMHPHLRSFVLSEEETLIKFKECWYKAVEETVRATDRDGDTDEKQIEKDWQEYSKSL